MSAYRAGVDRKEGLATERQISSAVVWATIPKELRSVLVRNGIHTASAFSNLFDGSHEDARALSFELVQSGAFGSALQDLRRECQVWHQRHVANLPRFTAAEAAASAVKRARIAGQIRLQLVPPSIVQGTSPV